MDDSTARHQVHSQMQQGDVAVQQVYTSSSHEPVTTMGEQHSSAPFQQAFSSIQEDIPVEILAEQHPNLVIQGDLDLWNKVQEYDQRTAEEIFTQVISKKTKKKQLKEQILGNPSYRTHSWGNPSPTNQ